MENNELKRNDLVQVYEPNNPLVLGVNPFEMFRKEIKSVVSGLSSLQQQSLSQYYDVKQSLNEIKDAVVKDKKEKKIRLPLREPATRKVFDELLARKREKHEWPVSYSRFCVAVTILWFTGLRINEIRNFTLKEVSSLMNTRELQVYQPKTNKYKHVVVSDDCSTILRFMEQEIETIFHTHPTLSGGCGPLSWIRFINGRLVKYTYGKYENVRSHSFRVNYTTSLLKNYRLEEVADMVGLF